MSAAPRVARRRGGKAATVLWVVIATLAWAVPAVASDAGSYAAVDRAMARRVHDDDLDGGVLVAATTTDGIAHRKAFGDVRATTVMPIASASKWLTTATLMTFVDDGTLRLDDTVASILPSFRGPKSSVTVRELVSHTSGLPSHGCLSDTSTTLAECVGDIAQGSDPEFPPGTEFSYGSTGFQVAGAIIEQLSGVSFQAAFAQRIAAPLAMTHTRFDGTSVRTANPVPAASATSTVDDYLRFLTMLAHGGTVDGERVLSESSVHEIERDQVKGLDTSRDGAVQITDIPTYGLGVWRDVVDARDDIRVVSGSGALGFYPWIDRAHDTYGIVAVADQYHGAEHAVPASQRLARMLWRAAARAQ
jgi:CubicO group peptidase (beta-lactamase class C family)